MDKFELEVVNALRELEVPAHVKGYEFIKSAIAEKHNTAHSRVERGIRHALEIAQSDFQIQKKVLGTSRDLTNRDFLATLHETIKIKLASDPELVEGA